MDPSRWQQIDELFQGAVGLPADQHEAYLANACQGDEDLRREVMSLLVRDGQSNTLLDGVTATRAPNAVAAATSADWQDRRLGPWRLRHSRSAASYGSTRGTGLMLIGNLISSQCRWGLGSRTFGRSQRVPASSARRSMILPPDEIRGYLKPLWGPT